MMEVDLLIIIMSSRRDDISELVAGDVIYR